MVISANNGMKRIFFGGTFNPIHIGHTRLALECQQQLAAPLAFVPCGDPPHKSRPEVTAQQRLTMVSLAVDELNAAVKQECFSVEPLEMELDQRSFTLITLQNLRRRYPNDVLYWLIGMDSLATLAAWHRWQELTDWANLLVVNRPGWTLPEEGVIAEWMAGKLVTPEQADVHGNVVLLPSTPLDIASRILRQQLQKADFGKFLLPESVRQYVSAQGLYHQVN